MNNKAITLLCLAAIVLLSVAGTKVSRLTRTQTFSSNDLFIVVTGSTVKVTRHVRAKDLAEGLGPWITNASAAGGSVTNAGAYVGSAGGKGTNNQFFGITTNTSLYVVSTSEFLDNVTIGGELNILGYPNVADSLDSLQGRQGGSDVLTNIIGTGAITNVGSSLLSASNHYARIVLLTTNDNITLSLSNAQNNTTYILSAGNYALTPSIMDSNRVAGNAVRGIVMMNKTNVNVIASGLVELDGRSSVGELMYLSNCSNIRIEGASWYGYTNHNFTVLPEGTSYLWSTLSIYKSEFVTVENNFFRGGSDHGIGDYSAQQAVLNTPSTNGIRILNNRFEDYGSWRTNTGSAHNADGTCIVPVGGWLIENNTFKNIHRAVEPYEDSGNFVQKGVIVRNNKAENIVEFFFSPAGSTNMHNGIVSGNYIFNPAAWSWRGTNYGLAGYGAGDGIVLNGGRGWKINDNFVEGSFYNAYRIGLSGAPVGDCELNGNTAINIDRGDVIGYGFWIGDVAADTALKANNVRGLVMRGNKAFRCANGAYRIFSGRDIVFENNFGYQPALTVGNAISSSAFLAGWDGYTVNKITNLTVRFNTMLDGGVGAMYGFGFYDNVQSCLFQDNIASGYTGAAGLGVTNRSGTAIAQYNTDATSTNRVLRAHEVRTQIEAGSNITLATNSSGVVTITGAAGAASTNFITTAHGSINVTNSVTAQNFIGSGTGVPIIKLQTLMSADNAFAITVDTNYFGLTNTFSFTNMVVGQRMRVKSVSNGNPTWEVPQLISGVLTNTTSVQADWTGAELIHITNSLIANVVIIPTNMIGGRSLRVIAQASTQTYTLSVSNAAGTVVLYPFASTNGGSAYTVTNGQTVELDLLSLNGKIHAAMGRFQ